MLKIRLMGTVKDLKWYRKIIMTDSRVRVLRISDPLPNKGTNRNFRMYVEVESEEK